eukprot:m.130648 g.130648  ORF g.130648 m.130648 type:complete len:351 (-) comp16439_c0_seq2:156-1208(-)
MMEMRRAAEEAAEGRVSICVVRWTRSRGMLSPAKEGSMASVSAKARSISTVSAQEPSSTSMSRVTRARTPPCSAMALSAASWPVKRCRAWKAASRSAAEPACRSSQTRLSMAPLSISIFCVSSWSVAALSRAPAPVLAALTALLPVPVPEVLWAASAAASAISAVLRRACTRAAAPPASSMRVRLASWSKQRLPMARKAWMRAGVWCAAAASLSVSTQAAGRPASPKMPRAASSLASSATTSAIFARPSSVAPSLSACFSSAPSPAATFSAALLLLPVSAVVVVSGCSATTALSSAWCALLASAEVASVQTRSTSSLARSSSMLCDVDVDVWGCVCVLMWLCVVGGGVDV